MNDLLNERTKIVQRVIDLLIGADTLKIQHNAQELKKVLAQLENQTDSITFKTKHYAAPAEMRH